MISSRNEDRVSVVDLPCEDQQNKSGSSTSHSLLAGLNLEGGRHYKRAFVNHQDVNPVLRNRQKEYAKKNVTEEAFGKNSEVERLDN
jgi:hypothetical protein